MDNAKSDESSFKPIPFSLTLPKSTVPVIDTWMEEYNIDKASRSALVIAVATILLQAAVEWKPRDYAKLALELENLRNRF